MSKVEELFSVRGKTVLVTGGSRGIGLMIARGFVENGARVYISSRKAEVCDRVAKELRELGDCVSLPYDLGSMAGIVGLAADLLGQADQHAFARRAAARDRLDRHL